MNARSRASEARTDAAFFLFVRASHATLTSLGEQLRHAIEADIRPDIQRLWCELETRLLGHLEAEERFVLPAFARVDRDEALALIREHGQIREQILELGMAVELHYARLAPFEQFAEVLRAHAAREEALLYRWASTMLDPRLAEAATQHMTRSRDQIADGVTPRHSR